MATPETQTLTASTEAGKPPVTPFLLHGSDRFGLTATTQRIYYPWDNATLIGEACQAEAAHIELIERAAEAGFAAFKTSTPTQRAVILNRLADLLQSHHEEMACMITRESGKPIKLSRVEVDRAIG